MMQTQTFAKNPAALFSGVIVNNELAHAHYAPAAGSSDQYEAVAVGTTKEKTCKPTRNPCCKPTKDTKNACCKKADDRQDPSAGMDLMMV
jgi:hypothetical protein